MKNNYHSVDDCKCSEGLFLDFFGLGELVFVKFEDFLGLFLKDNQSRSENPENPKHLCQKLNFLTVKNKLKSKTNSGKYHN